MGTGPRLRSSSVSQLCFIRSKKFNGNFTMALCSFEGVSDQCGATAWAPHETGMVPLLSCENDMTEWLKEKYKGSGASGARGEPGHTKAAGDSKYLLGIIHAHKWLLSRSSRLFSVEERPRYPAYDIVVSNCLFMTD